MGHRANLVLVQDDRASVRYDHWAAHDLSCHLVLGPEYTLRWVRQQESVDHLGGGGWLDEVWCQGGLTMDLDHRRLTWFDMPTEDDLARRSVVADLLTRTWPGWTVRRADEGIGDLAVAAGVSAEQVRNPDVAELITAMAARAVTLRENPPGSGRWSPAAEEPYYCLVTVARGDDLAVSLVDHCHAAWLGSALVERVLAGPGAVRSGARAVDLRHRHLSGGVHVDLDARRMSYWSTGGTHGLAEHVQQRWGPDVDVIVLAGRITDHLALTGGFVVCDAPDFVATATELAADLVQTHRSTTAHPAIQALSALTTVFGDVPPGVNPAIADHHPVAATTEELAEAANHLAELVRRYSADEPAPAGRSTDWSGPPVMGTPAAEMP